MNIHATCVVLRQLSASFDAPADAGILLLGDSGSGKSDLALRMIERGAILVADDRVDLSVFEQKLFAAVPGTIAGLLEVRGAGIVRMPHEARARITLAILLVPPADVPRMPEFERFSPPSPLSLTPENWPPLLRLAPFEESAPAKIALAAAAFAKNRFAMEVNKL
ncbi:MAG: HPr kinase/phosphatase C-terminal domain-containing protein [Proteobacteria bacterium]|nr:HPr kinase/phosphatase C-terminal domain-containing protein [Pseudomonadota bacterium]